MSAGTGRRDETALNIGRMSARRTHTFHAAALVVTLAVAATNGCGREAAPSARQARIEDFGAGASRCTAWSDGCQICQRGPSGGAAACSLPGIACTRGPVICTATAP